MRNLVNYLISDKLKIANVVLMVAIILSAMLVVYSNHNNHLLFGKLEKLTKQRDDLNVEWGQLLLEQSTWATDSRIEKIATEQLGMKNVEFKDTVIIKL